MRNLIIVCVTLLTTLLSNAQDITGQWSGVLKVQGIQLRIIFNVSQTGNGLKTTMDSPDQGIKDIPVTKTIFDNPQISFEVDNFGIKYNGELKGDEIIGVFKQGYQEFPMNLSRGVAVKDIIKRPQEPTKPYLYHSEEVIFKNEKADITLSGTLTLPKKKGIFPAVVLISGSGPQNRDEEMLGHKPFLILSDYLTKNGIAVLRYDDRGVGQSTGDFSTSTSADFASDVQSAITYLKTRKEINKKMIGLIGHSEGGLIAPMVASQSEDVGFIVLLAGTGMQGDKLLLLQSKLIAKANGMSDKEITESQELNSKLFEIVVNSNDTTKLKADLTKEINKMIDSNSTFKIPSGMKREDFVAMQVDQLASPWMIYFMKYNPINALEQVSCPVLALNGEKDLQVPPKENLKAIKKSLEKGGNKKVTIIEFPNLNHLFQESNAGLPNEYANIEQTISPKVLEEITKWIKTQTE